KPAAVLLQGTATNATTVQVQILDCGANLVCDTGNDDQYWNGSAFVSTTGWTNNGFVGVTSFNAGTGAWQMSVPAGSWVAGARTSRTPSEGVNHPDRLPHTPGPNPIFVVDPQNPSGTITAPDARAYRNSLPTLPATASDTAPGVVQTVVFRVARGEDATKFWN